MIRMPQLDISQLVNREAQSPALRAEGSPEPAGDFMAMIQQRVQSESAEPGRGREPVRPRAEERPEAAANEAGEPAMRETARPATENAEARPGERTETGQEAPRKPENEVPAGEARATVNKDGSVEPPRVKLKGRTEKTIRGERAPETGVNALVAPVHNETVKASAQAALQSLKGLGDPAPEMKNLEKTLQAFQEILANGADRPGKPELTHELRARLKDALRHLERREGAETGEGREKIAEAKARIRSLESVMDRQVRDGGNGRQKPQAGQAGSDQRAQQPSQDFTHAMAPRETRQQAERISDGDGRDSGVNAINGRNIQSQARSAAQAAVTARSPIFNEQFESIMNSARMVVRDGKNGSFVMNLYPETMGRVNVNLGLDDGVIVGRFLVDSTEARELMLENIDGLRLKLEEAGIQVGSFQVNVRGERERLVRQLQEGMSRTAGRESEEARRDYEIQSYRRHDGALDVTA